MSYKPPAELPDLDGATTDELRAAVGKLNNITRIRVSGRGSKQMSLTKEEMLTVGASALQQAPSDSSGLGGASGSGPPMG